MSTAQKPGRKRSAKKASTARRRASKRVADRGIRIGWSNLVQLHDFSGAPFRRFYSLETLASSVEKHVGTNAGFIVASVRDVLGPPPLSSMKFELFQEGRYQLIFKMQVANRNRNRETFGLVVAKNAAELSASAKTEHANLRLLHNRAPRHVVEPFRGGAIYLPDRHRRAGRGREVYGYVTRWLGGYHELGIGRNHLFFINEKKKYSFSADETQRIKQRMVETIIRTYDPLRRTCMAVPQIASGDFVVTRPRSGGPRVKLIACRELHRRVTPTKLIEMIVRAEWNWLGRTFFLSPRDPKWLIESILNGAGREKGRLWLGQYAGAVAAGRLSESEALPLSRLKASGLAGPRR